MGLEAAVIRLYRLRDCWPPCIGRVCNHVGFFQLSRFQTAKAGSKRALPLVSMPIREEMGDPQPFPVKT